MAFVKLDCNILSSSVWIHRDVRDVFITCLLMAIPHVLDEPTPTLKIGKLEPDDFVVPEGCYGFIPAAAQGISLRALVPLEQTRAALEVLSSPDPDSRSQDFDGRRVVRIDGGFIVLNFDKYRDQDLTAAERAKRYRDRKKAAIVTGVTRDNRDGVTQAEAEAEVEVINSSFGKEEYAREENSDSSDSRNGQGSKSKRFVKPKPAEVEAYGREIGYEIDGAAFCDFYESKGWRVGSSPMKDWKAAVRTWKKRDEEKAKTNGEMSLMDEVREINRKRAERERLQQEQQGASR